ncbi:MAG: hypothetical protein ACFE9L_18385 [Candidatus Hodarchaeota archaeon]
MAQKQEFLTEYELEVFKLVNEGKNPQEIADQINSNWKFEGQKERRKENIRKTRVVVRNKIERELQRIATANRLDLDLAKMPKDTGMMIAFDWVHNTKVYLFFTSEKGILAWWEHECSKNCESICNETLELILRERKIKLPPKIKEASLLEQFRYVVSVIQEKGE